MEVILYKSRGLSKSGEAIKFLYCGIKEGMTYIKHYIESGFINEMLEVIYEETIDIDKVNDSLLKNDCDLSIIALPKERVLTIKKEHDQLMPLRIHQIVRTELGMNEIKKRMSKREVKRYEKLKSNFSFQVRHDNKSFFDFYKNMHKPTMNTRYGSFARSVNIDDAFNNLFKKGVLFYINQNGKPVSGSVSQIDIEKNWLNARLIGVLDGKDEYLANGAQNFVYHSIIDWACNDGKIDVVDFQGCEPFLTKGTFQYKKRFATEAILPPNFFYDKRVLLRFNKESMSVRNYLISNPIITINNNDIFSATYFEDISNNAKLDIPYFMPGIDNHKIVKIL
ncbi:hypothetical protein [Aliivibrio fischeri]|uniref:hypothetical protein n=1 Tax=Aliivibrio fischeri TaxID=668 RepID=UPI0012DADF6D|nr:hypothetical protein [Aliivibrio fischeri]MUK64044.1 hypothetical protein [Aliivibrio fischeri]